MAPSGPVSRIAGLHADGIGAISVLSTLVCLACASGPAVPTLSTRELIDKLAVEKDDARKAQLGQLLAEQAKPQDVKAIEALLGSVDEQRRWYAIGALERVDQDRAAVAMAAELTRRSDTYSLTRRLAALKNPRALPGMVEALKSNREPVCSHVGSAMQEIGAAPVAAQLLELSRSGEIWTRTHASAVLVAVDRPAGVAGLKAAWANRQAAGDAYQQARIAYVLSQAAAPELSAEYRDMLRHPDRGAVESGLYGIGYSRDVGAAPDVVVFVKTGRAPEVGNALLTLSLLQDAAATAQAAEHLKANPLSPGGVEEVVSAFTYQRLKDVGTADKENWLAILRGASKMTKAAAEIVKLTGECRHWGGEEPYDADRAAQIAQGQARSCTHAVKRTATLLRNNPRDTAAKHAAEECRSAAQEAGLETTALDGLLD